MPRREPRADRALLAGWIAAAFALSAVSDWRVLAGALGVSLLAFRRGALRHLARVAKLVLPLSIGASLATVVLDRLAGAPLPPVAPLAALNLRAALRAFLAVAVRARVPVLRA
ncbi:MAG TPA: hypothetical protein VFK90_10860, partial [Anaeromyxobacter sp.]|nr:hypothetical protein [Anaeromyxobacter sp.]